MGQDIAKFVVALGVALMAACAPPSGALSSDAPQPPPSAPVPLIIAHRGASGERPEHTIEAYELAIAQGADFIEPDLVMTKDGVLVARHENEISGTTDVADHPEFAARRRTQIIDGEEVSGWFTEDFTLAELKTLRARERLAQLRPANRAFDGQETIPTLEEVIQAVQAAEGRLGRRIGLYPETKHPSHFAALGLALEPALVAILARYGYATAQDPVFIQSFEMENLRRLNEATPLRLIQLLAGEFAPPDRAALGDARMGAEWARPEGLAEIAAYADGIGVEKAMVIPRDANSRLTAPSDLVRNAHAARLLVHVWTFRSENFFLPASFQIGAEPQAKGDFAAEYRAFQAAGIDGLFSDQPADAIAALKAQP